MTKRKPRKALSKSYLQSLGFLEPEWDEKEGSWRIYRFWPYGYKTAPVLKEIKITEALCKHKYGKDKTYHKLTFAAYGERINITLSRFIYAWFVGNVPEYLDVEHINNDPFDNSVSNLRLATRKDNLAKRFNDDPRNAVNQ